MRERADDGFGLGDGGGDERVLKELFRREALGGVLFETLGGV